MQERVVELPQDQDRWYCTLMGDQRSPEYRQLVSWFRSHPNLKALTKQMHFSVMPIRSQMFRSRYAATTAALPCVRIQDAKGDVLFQASGSNIPLSADALYNAMKASCLRHFRRRPDQHIHYHNEQPEPQPEPDPRPEAKPVPDVFVEAEPVIPWFAYVGAGAGGLAVGALVHWRHGSRSRQAR